eukprot:RCo016552
MGNEIAKTYDVTSSTSTASGGPYMLWKIYPAVKRSTKEEVSIFALDKRVVEKKFSLSPKAAADLYKVLKSGVQRMTKLHHPCILKVVQPLTESKQEIFFMTEPVFGSLDNILGNLENVDSPSEKMKSFDLPLLERQFGAFQVCEALAFIHHDAGLLHLNVYPGNIFVTMKGDWKVSGFDFSCGPTAGDELRSFKVPDNLASPVLMPALDYAAPEYVNENRPCRESDTWSLGCTLYRTLAAVAGQPTPTLFAVKDTESYMATVYSGLNQAQPPASFPHGLFGALTMMLSVVPAQRPALRHVLDSSPLFCGREVKALRYLSAMMNKDPLQKVSFLKELPDMIPAFSVRLLRLKVIPPLVAEMTDERMLRFVLPLLLRIVERLQPSEYEVLLMPYFTPLFQRVDIPQISEMLVESIDPIVEKSSQNIVKHYIVPLLCLQMKNNPNPRVAIASINKSVDLAKRGLVIYTDFRREILPSLVLTITSTRHSAVRSAAISSLSAVADLIDRDTITEILEPAVKAALNSDQSPEVVIAVFNVYRSISDQYGSEFICSKLLPFLCPLLLKPTLTLQQFQAMIGTFKYLMGKVEVERSAMLAKSSAYEQLTTGLEPMTAPAPPAPPAVTALPSGLAGPPAAP